MTEFGIGIFMMCFLIAKVQLLIVIICLVCALMIGCILIYRLRHYVEVKKVLPTMLAAIKQ
ncbi:MAG: hypothetical protein U0M15_06635 [Bacillota bacterium]|nr:hypothetical protein [Bacillota bacterium]